MSPADALSSSRSAASAPADYVAHRRSDGRLFYLGFAGGSGGGDAWRAVPLRLPEVFAFDVVTFAPVHRAAATPADMWLSFIGCADKINVGGAVLSVALTSLFSSTFISTSAGDDNKIPYLEAVLVLAGPGEYIVAASGPRLSVVRGDPTVHASVGEGELVRGDDEENDTGAIADFYAFRLYIALVGAPVTSPVRIKIRLG